MTDNNTNKINRRTLMKSCGGSVLAALAGCIGNNNDSQESNPVTENTPQSTPTEEPELEIEEPYPSKIPPISQTHITDMDGELGISCYFDYVPLPIDAKSSTKFEDRTYEELRETYREEGVNMPRRVRFEVYQWSVVEGADEWELIEEEGYWIADEDDESYIEKGTTSVPKLEMELVQEEPIYEETYKPTNKGQKLRRLKMKPENIDLEPDSLIYLEVRVVEEEAKELIEESDNHSKEDYDFEFSLGKTRATLHTGLDWEYKYTLYDTNTDWYYDTENWAVENSFQVLNQTSEFQRNFYDRGPFQTDNTLIKRNNPIEVKDGMGDDRKEMQLSRKADGWKLRDITKRGTFARTTTINWLKPYKHRPREDDTHYRESPHTRHLRVGPSGGYHPTSIGSVDSKKAYGYEWPFSIDMLFDQVQLSRIGKMTYPQTDVSDNAKNLHQGIRTAIDDPTPLILAHKLKEVSKKLGFDDDPLQEIRLVADFVQNFYTIASESWGWRTGELELFSAIDCYHPLPVVTQGGEDCQSATLLFCSIVGSEPFGYTPYTIHMHPNEHWDPTFGAAISSANPEQVGHVGAGIATEELELGDDWKEYPESWGNTVKQLDRDISLTEVEKPDTVVEKEHGYGNLKERWDTWTLTPEVSDVRENPNTEIGDRVMYVECTWPAPLGMMDGGWTNSRFNVDVTCHNVLAEERDNMVGFTTDEDPRAEFIDPKPITLSPREVQFYEKYGYEMKETMEPWNEDSRTQSLDELDIDFPDEPIVSDD